MAWCGVTWLVQRRKRNEKMVHLGNPGSYDDPTNCLDKEKKELIGRIPYLEKWEWRKTLRGGFSGAEVFLAWVSRKGKPQSLDVFKFDSSKKSQKEKRNWKEYANYLDRRNVVSVKHFIPGQRRSLIVYDCASFDGHLETFAEHYG